MIFTIKCMVCVNRSLQNKDLSTDKPVQEGLDGARLAVVVADGKSLCAEHFHDHLMSKLGGSLKA